MHMGIIIRCNAKLEENTNTLTTNRYPQTPIQQSTRDKYSNIENKPDMRRIRRIYRLLIGHISLGIFKPFSCQGSFPESYNPVVAGRNETVACRILILEKAIES